MRIDPFLGLLDVGDIPYNVLRPILLKIDDAKQLVRIPRLAVTTIHIPTNPITENSRAEIPPNLGSRRRGLGRVDQTRCDRLGEEALRDP